MQHGGPLGLHNAPVTKVLLCTSAFLTIVAGIRGRRLGLSIEDFRNLHLWRVVPSVLAFSSTHELLVGLYLIYYFRIFERQVGPNKYSVFVLFSLTVSACFQILALTFLKDTIPTRLASGPYGLIFASFVFYFLDIPVTSRFNVLGLSLSDKSGIYLAGLQLLFSSWKGSLVPGICGLLAGLLYLTNAFGIRRLRFPRRIAYFFSRLFLPSSPNYSRRLHVRGPYAVHQVQRNFPSMAHVQFPEPPEPLVATLVSMGFDGVAARQALMQARNDINVATNILLESQTQ